MANVVIFDIGTNRIVSYFQSVDSNLYIARPDVVIDPDLSALSGIPKKYWKHEGGSIVTMTQGEKDTFDAEREASRKAILIAKLDAMSDAPYDITVYDLAKALVQLGVVDGTDLKQKMKEVKGLV